MKIIKYITELTFRKNENVSGVLYDVIGKDIQEWEDIDELLITINHQKKHNAPPLLNTILSVKDDSTIIVPIEPMTCEVDAKDNKILMKCEI